MKLSAKLVAVVSVALLGWATWAAAKHSEQDTGKKDPHLIHDSIILIVRHAEKPETGPLLAPEGQQRAAAYVNYFKTFTVDSEPLILDALYAAADSEESHRPRLTIEPLARALNLKIETPFKDKQFAELAKHLETKPAGRHILICWHHGEIPGLIRALGGDPEKLLPDGKWPAHEFGWVIQLRYDHNGRLIPEESRRINENLSIGDKIK